MLDSQANPQCYKAVLIVGPGSEYGYNTLKSMYDRPDCLIIGDGIRDISLEEIETALKDKVDHNTRIDVELHARITKDDNNEYHHFLNLNFKSTGQTTRSEDLVEMLDRCSAEPLSIELRCCYGGMVQNTLKPGSALITHSHWGEFFFEDVGAHSLAKLLDDHFRSNSKPILDRITDNLPAYAINPVKISIVSNDGEVVDYTIRHAKQLIIGPTNFLNWHMGEYYKQFSDLIEDESMNLADNPVHKLPALTPEEREDYIYGSIVYQRDQVVLLKFYNRLLDKHPEVLRSLLRKKIGRHDLVLHALDEGQTDVIKFITQNLDKLTEDIADQNERTSVKNNLLNRIYRHAIKKENVELLKILLASPQSTIKMLDGESLLTYAISRKYNNVTQMLIKNKVGLDQKNMKGMAAIDILINQMIALDNDLKEARIIPAEAEAREQINLQMLKAMLKTRVKLDSRGPDGLTPIFRAVELNDPELIKRLLTFSEEADQKCNKESLLEYGIKLRKEKVVMLLSNDQARLTSLTVADDANERAATLSWAAQQGLDKVITAMLASPKTVASDLTVPNKLGNTPLILAVMKGHTKVVKAMLASNKVDTSVLNFPDASSTTALTWAVKLNHKGIVNIMLASGKVTAANDLPNKEGKSALMLALELGHNDIALALIQAKIGIDTPNKEGTTPLMQAAAKNNVMAVKALIKAKAVKTLRDKEGYTALEIANQAGHQDIVVELTPKEVNKPPTKHAEKLSKEPKVPLPALQAHGSHAEAVTAKKTQLKPVTIHAASVQSGKSDNTQISH